ncbi:MAG: tetratricopeptide repeat protein [Polyangiaceae bacterium]
MSSLRSIPQWLACSTVTTLSIMLGGCATAPSVFGNQARYSPAFHGYVMAAQNGSDDPSIGDTVLVLRDPVSGNKLRCKEDVEAWREVYEDTAVDRVQDDNAALAAGITAGIFFGAVVAMQPTSSLLVTSTLSLEEPLYDLMRSEDGTELLAAGIVLYQRKRFPQAARVIERALAKDASVGVLDKGYFYLGQTYFEQGNRERAAGALQAFVQRAGVRDVDAYREALSTLRRLDHRESPCDSIEPVDLHW